MEGDQRIVLGVEEIFALQLAVLHVASSIYGDDSKSEYHQSVSRQLYRDRNSHGREAKEEQHRFLRRKFHRENAASASSELLGGSGDCTAGSVSNNNRKREQS
jgi:hypothetical protein